MEIGEKFACKCVMMQRRERERERENGRHGSNNEYFQSTECKMLDPICGQWARLHKHYCIRLANNMIRSTFKLLTDVLTQKFLRSPQGNARSQYSLTANHVDVRFTTTKKEVTNIYNAYRAGQIQYGLEPKWFA